MDANAYSLAATVKSLALKGAELMYFQTNLRSELLEAQITLEKLYGAISKFLFMWTTEPHLIFNRQEGE